MRWNEIDQIDCSVARALRLLGESWTLMIIRHCFMNCRRFDDFQSRLGMTRHLLATRLKMLVDNGILEKTPYQFKPTRYEYTLLPKGEGLFPIIISLMQWGDEWASVDVGSSPLELLHTRCNSRARPRLDCSNCNAPMTSRNTLAVINS